MDIVCEYMCVFERERERGGGRERGGERERERERERGLVRVVGCEYVSLW
jgi:hypothetical protein